VDDPSGHRGPHVPEEAECSRAGESLSTLHLVQQRCPLLPHAPSVVPMTGAAAPLSPPPPTTLAV
jgi:hypothetical protein